MTRTIAGCTPHVGAWLGVPIPDGVTIIDCRATDEEIFSDAHKVDGRTLWGSERAAYYLGREPFTTTTPRAVQVYEDYRNATDGKIACLIPSMVRDFQAVDAEYLDAKRRPARKGDGGSVHYKPIACVLNNYGYSILADENDYAVRTFERAA